MKLKELKQIDDLLERAKVIWFELDTPLDTEEYPITWETLKPPIDSSFYPRIYLADGYVTLSFERERPFWISEGGYDVVKELADLLNKLWEGGIDETVLH